MLSFPISETRIWGVLQRIAICYGIASILVYFLSFRTVIGLSILFLVGYWLILLGWGDPADPFSLAGNAGLHLDKFLFGDAHLYHGEGVAFDPEGLLSTLPAIVNVVIGYYADSLCSIPAKLRKRCEANAGRLYPDSCRFVLEFGIPNQQKIMDEFVCLINNGY